MTLNQDYLIRKIEQNDQDFLFEMLYQSIYVLPDTPKPDRDIIKDPKISKYVENWGKLGDDGLIVIDKVSGEKLGAVWLRYFGYGNKGYGYIDDNIPELGIAVDYNNRGKGIGTLLLDELLKKVDKKINTISLSVDPRNHVVRLYKRIGFIKCGISGTSITMRYDNIKEES